MKKVVKSGVFDPRAYKNNDPDWAKKRKPEYMGPGKYVYTREFTEDDNPKRFCRQDIVAQFRERLKSESQGSKPEEDKEELEPVIQVPINIERKKIDIWPKRVRSDITIMFR